MRIFWHNPAQAQKMEEKSTRMDEEFVRKDLFWLLAYPLYQTIGTMRHEASHALFALVEGATIKQFVFWPSMRDSTFYWGYVRWSGQVSWVVTAAPYLVAFAWYVVFFVICTRISFKRHWIWVNLVAIGLITPLVDSAYNYIRGISGSANDVAKLLQGAPLPDWASHAYFVLTLAVCIVGILYLLLRGKVKSRRQRR